MQVISQIFLILQLLFYSAVVSAAIKYVIPSWSLLSGLTPDLINAIALYLITLPVIFFAFVLWLRR